MRKSSSCNGLPCSRLCVNRILMALGAWQERQQQHKGSLQHKQRLLVQVYMHPVRRSRAWDCPRCLRQFPGCQVPTHSLCASQASKRIQCGHCIRFQYVFSAPSANSLFLLLFFPPIQPGLPC